MEEHFIIPVIAAIVTALVPAFLGQIGFTAAKGDGEQPTKKQLIWIRTGAFLLGTGVFAYLFWGRGQQPDPNMKPSLDRVTVLPNPAVPHRTIAINIYLSKPAPAGGASVLLSSEDKLALALDGNMTIPEGQAMLTSYYQLAALPANGSSVRIQAFYDGRERDTFLNVSSQEEPSTKAHTTGKPPSAFASNNPAATPAQKRTEAPTHPAEVLKPAPLSPELVSRLEEAEAQLSSEEQYWQNVKQHMPSGTSLRPEISSQISAAKSAAQRCSKARDAADPGSLSSCIDALNDHLIQLKIQH